MCPGSLQSSFDSIILDTLSMKGSHLHCENVSISNEHSDVIFYTSMCSLEMEKLSRKRKMCQYSLKWYKVQLVNALQHLIAVLITIFMIHQFSGGRAVSQEQLFWGRTGEKHSLGIKDKNRYGHQALKSGLWIMHHLRIEFMPFWHQHAIRLSGIKFKHIHWFHWGSFIYQTI